jgi:hypothetical protein
MESHGYRVSYVDVDRQPEVAKQYSVSQLPTLLIVANNQVVDRIVGALPPEALLERLQQVQARLPDAATAAASSSSNAGASRETPESHASPPSRSVPQGEANVQGHDIEQRAARATVRLRVEDPQGQSYGTGTVIDVHGADALILTCGHIFRESKGRGRVTVDLFASDSATNISGDLIGYDLDRDVALVGIRTAVPIEPVRIAPPGYRMDPGASLFTLGCDHGQAPSVLRGELRAVNKYLGPENFVVSGQPADGRSGGGLFSYDGYLVGVCNAADPELGEGLYAAFPSIHRQLDASKLAFVYASPTAPTAQSQLATVIQQPDESVTGGGGAEVICIVRPREGGDAKSELIVLDRPSRSFMDQLRHEGAEQQQRRLTQLREPRRLRPKSCSRSRETSALESS